MTNRELLDYADLLIAQTGSEKPEDKIALAQAACLLVIATRMEEAGQR